MLNPYNCEVMCFRKKHVQKPICGHNDGGCSKGTAKEPTNKRHKDRIQTPFNWLALPTAQWIPHPNLMKTKGLQTQKFTLS